jgi:hypothetical protein
VKNLKKKVAVVAAFSSFVFSVFAFTYTSTSQAVAENRLAYCSTSAIDILNSRNVPQFEGASCRAYAGPGQYRVITMPLPGTKGVRQLLPIIIHMVSMFM